VERLRSLSAELQQMYHGLGSTAERPQDAGPGGPGGPGGAPGAAGGPGAADEDVIDAEFTTPE
jgi:molecular chaperone DnaK